jgi:hypothetical protein
MLVFSLSAVVALLERYDGAIWRVRLMAIVRATIIKK